MPAIKEMKKVLAVTPMDQAIMIEANHGCGKSEFIRDYYLAEGFEVITLFLGQMADAGDLIGLPDRLELTKVIDGKEVTHRVTEFCPPKWWNFDPNAKVVVFMDEFNRGKPEVYQCVFDMVLNRKLNGYSLPENTRIIAAVNPIDSSFDYDVKELDSALLDRFNVYRFAPSVEDWIDWAVGAKVHKNVIGFINKNRAFLDPEMKTSSNDILPSRRSWKRVSDIINHSASILSDEELFKTVLMGVVGIGATAKFWEYTVHEANQLSALNIINMKYKDDSVIKKVKVMSNQEVLAMNKEMAMYLAENFDVLKDSSDSSRYVSNIERYLSAINNECRAEFFGSHVSANNPWAVWLLKENPTLARDFIKILQGKSKEEKALEAHLNNEDVADKENLTADDDGEGWKKAVNGDEDSDLSSAIDDLCK